MNDLFESALGSKPKASGKAVDKRHHGIARHVVHHHHDGTHHIEVHPIGGGEPIHLGAKNVDEVHDHLENNLNGPPSDEEMAEHEAGEE